MIYPHPTQDKVIRDKHRFRVINCGRRWGKTTLTIEEIKCCALSKPARICYIAPTYQQARDIAWEMLKAELLPIATNINESRLEIRVKTQDGQGESVIYLRGWESIETLRGQKFNLIVIDEIAMMRNFWLNWEEIIRPTLTDERGEAIFISTPKGFNHFYDLFNKEATDKDYKSYHFTSYENPFLPVEELDKAKQELTEDRFAQEYMADFRKTEGLVYKEFDRFKHIYTEPILMPITETLAGVDFGFTNPCAVIEVKKDYNGIYWIASEYYKSGKTDLEVAEYVAGKGFNKVYPDPENPAAIKELANKGVNVREVLKGKDSIKNGINKLRELLKANKLYIHSSCVNLIWEFETYSYPDKKDMHNEEELPIKENDHALDALRYIFNGQVDIEKRHTAGQHIPQGLSRRPLYQVQ